MLLFLLPHTPRELRTVWIFGLEVTFPCFPLPPGRAWLGAASQAHSGCSRGEVGRSCRAGERLCCLLHGWAAPAGERELRGGWDCFCSCPRAHSSSQPHVELVLAHTSDAQGRGEAEQRGKAWKYRVRLWYFLAWGVDFAAEKTIFELFICQDPDRVNTSFPSLL